MSADEMIACLGSCRARGEIAAMIKALSLQPSLNTPVEAKRLEAASAAMANWTVYSHACQARHNAHRSVGQIAASTELFCPPRVDVEGTSPPPAAVCARGGAQAFEQPNPFTPALF